MHQSFVDNLPSLPGVEVIVCGPVGVRWLAPSPPLGDEELRATLHPDEWAYAQTLKAAPRRREYLRARWLLRKLTGYKHALPKTTAGAPSWPPGLVGSLTHKDGWVGVALARATEAASIGIDAEDVARMKEAFEARICLAAESELIDTLVTERRSREFWLSVVFSFKEALFKSHFPLGETMFYFHDAEVVKLTGTEIAAKVLMPTSPETPAGFVSEGHWVERLEAGRQFIVSSCTVSTGMP